MIDLVDEIEKIVGIHPVLAHPSPHGGAVAPVEILLLAEGIVIGGVEEFGDVVADALVDLLPEVEVVRIERVIEIEHPGIDVSKGPRRGVGRWVGRRCRGHGCGSGHFDSEMVNPQWSFGPRSSTSACADADVEAHAFPLMY